MSEKPKAQTLGVNGIEAKPITMNEQGDELNLHLLAAFPPFQMWLCENQENNTSLPIDSWAEAILMNEIHSGTLEALISDYIQWHENKGYWKGEDPLGQASAGVAG